MTTLLIQVNDAKLSEVAPPDHIEAGGKGPRYCDDPLTHQQYVNGGDHWKQEGFDRREAWVKAAEGDLALLYSTSGVHEEWGASLSHVLRVGEKQIGEVGARLFFDRVEELDPKIPYHQIQDSLETNEFSERIRYCGQEGFNITHINAADLETIETLTDFDRDEL
jgi:hypothetical protein